MSIMELGRMYEIELGGWKGDWSRYANVCT